MEINISIPVLFSRINHYLQKYTVYKCVCQVVCTENRKNTVLEKKITKMICPKDK